MCREKIYKIENDIDKIYPLQYIYLKMFDDLEISILLDNSKMISIECYMHFKYNEYYISSYDRKMKLYEEIYKEIENVMKILFLNWKLKKDNDEDNEYIIDCEINYVNQNKTIHIVKNKNNNYFDIYTY